MFWGYVSTENCRSKNMQFLEHRRFSWEKGWFLMFATCTKKKHAWFFGPTLLPKKLHEDFRKHAVFWSKTRCKTAAAPQIDKKHSWRCSPRLPFWPQVDLLSILGSLEGTPKPAFGTKCRLKVAKKWKKDFIQGSPRVPKMWFSVQNYILVRFYSSTGGPNASSGRIWAPESSKSGGSLR